MRITTGMIADNYIGMLSDGLNRLNNYFEQMSSEKKFSRASDDPADAMKAYQSLHELDEISQYSDSISEAKSWVNNSESTVNIVNEIAKSAQETVNAANSNATLNSDDEKTYEMKLEGLQSELLQTLNSTFSGRYVFGGPQRGPAPFRAGTAAEDGAANDGKLMIYNYNGNPPSYVPFSGINSSSESSMSLTLPVDMGLGMRTDSNGKVVAGTAMDIQTSSTKLLALNMNGTGCEDLYDVIGDAVSKLKNGGMPDLGGDITKLQSAQDSILQVTTGIGEKTDMLDFLSGRNDSNSISQKSRLSQIQDVDIEQAIMQYQTQQVVYNVSLSVGSKILQKNLFDFLE